MFRKGANGHISLLSFGGHSSEDHFVSRVGKLPFVAGAGDECAFFVSFGYICVGKASEDIEYNSSESKDVSDLIYNSSPYILLGSLQAFGAPVVLTDRINHRRLAEEVDIADGELVTVKVVD